MNKTIMRNKYMTTLLNRDNAKFYENSKEGATKSMGKEAEEESGCLGRWGTVRRSSMCIATKAWKKVVECSKMCNYLSVHEAVNMWGMARDEALGSRLERLGFHHIHGRDSEIY